MTDLIELIYTSLSSQHLDNRALNALITQARRKNTLREVTGLLCFDGKTFLQIIEGPREQIDNLYKIIESDERHSQVDLIYTGTIEKREFSDWNMAFQNVPENLLSAVQDKVAIMSFDDHKNHIKESGSSFGARIFSLFINSLYTEQSQLNI